MRAPRCQIEWIEFAHVVIDNRFSVDFDSILSSGRGGYEKVFGVGIFIELCFSREISWLARYGFYGR